MASPSSHVYSGVQPHPITERQPTIPLVIQPTYPADPQIQARTITPVNHRGDTPTPEPVDSDYRDTDAQWVENYGDSSGRLWMMYLTKAEKVDKEITEGWKGEADGILVFTGLFSATVAAFTIESYKQLSPDPGVTTNALLTQISQQLVNISNETPLASVAAQNSQPFKPTASAVRVNVLWFLSLAISLNCALSATLMQQWARQYCELTRRRGAPHKSGRIRAFIFDGFRKFGTLARAVTPITRLLHISVFLFFAGLVEFLFPIYTTVAYTTLGCIGMFALPYAVLTVLPNFYLNCPYGTPLSSVTWRLSQFSALGILLAIRGIEGQFHGPLSTLWHLTHRQVTGPLGPTKWREMLDNQVAIHYRWLWDGLQKSVELGATGAPSTVDAYALEWTLTALHQNEEIEDFVESVPGFFDSRAVPDATSAILPLMSDQSTTDPILGSRLYDLLKTCIPGTSPLTEEKRRSRLRVCLRSLWFCGRAYNQPENSEPLPSYARIVFASPEMTYRIQTEQDPAARVIGRCFGALVAKKLSADIKLRRIRINDEILLCLSTILGTDSREVISLLGQPGAIELASIVSLMLVADPLVGDATSTDVLDLFKQTLHILSQTLLTEYQADLPLPQVAQFHEIYSKFPNWFKDELQQISYRLPPSPSYASGWIVGYPRDEPAQESWTSISVSQQSRENRVWIGGAPDSGIGDGFV
ncbi:hypothetical protein BJY52DRAFT_66137 [Lactarius psammicola]|nr:hypothetical protein BJY52DRAFT_66137 [Lactarius psammicola]